MWVACMLCLFGSLSLYTILTAQLRNWASLGVSEVGAMV